MDFPLKKTRVQGQTYKSRLENQDVGISHLVPTPQSVDGKLLDLVRSINGLEDRGEFPQLLADQLERIGYDLREAHSLIASRDSKGLDQLAQKLTQNALKVGAVKILSSAIEMQGLARIGDFLMAEQVLSAIEVEFLLVRSELA